MKHHTDPRNEPRYPVVSGSPLSTAVIVNRPETTAQLLELAQNGLRLAVDSKIKAGEQISLQLAPEILSHAVKARVMWSFADVRRGWLVGCSLAEPFPESAMSYFAAQQQLERRRDPRRPVACIAEARNIGSEGYEPVRLEDISVGGFCASGSHTKATIGDRILIRLKRPGNAAFTLVQGIVAWARKFDDGSVTFGCSFVGHGDFSSMLSVITQMSKERVEPPVTTKKFRKFNYRESATRWSLVGLAVTILVVTTQLLVLR